VHSGERLAGSILLTFFGAACSSAPSSPSPGIPADQLLGTWSLVSLQPAREPEQATAPGAPYTLTFGSGNQYSTQAECTACSGTFALTGATLSTGPVRLCASVNCQEMAFESRYKMLLTGDSTVALSTTTLQLSSARGVLRFTR